MKGSPNIARIGALIGDTTRANMLTALMSGKALTATELAREAGVTSQTASSHLGKLEQGGLLTLRKQGRHKYFALASADVAAVLEGLMGLVAGKEQTKYRVGPRDEALRQARVCYNHLAGDKGIQLYDGLMSQELLQLHDEVLSLSDKGQVFVREFGIDLQLLSLSKVPLCRQCLDWSERKSHLAGSLGRAFFSEFETRRWIKRQSDSRVVRFSVKGEVEFNKLF